MNTASASGSDLMINVNSNTVCYDDFGQGIIPVIFIHGFPFDKSLWQPQLDALQLTQRVIAYDIRGFGKSSYGEEKASIQLFADDLIQFMDVLEIHKAVLCGLSMGGYILLDLIHRFPDRVEAIILCDTQCTADSPEAKEKRLAAIADIEVIGLNKFANEFMQQVFSQHTVETKKKLVESITNIVLSTSTDAVTETLNALMQREDRCADLKKIAVPSLILCGTEDIITPPEKAQYLFDNIDDAEIHYIDRAGHLSNVEQADDFNEHLLEFISGL